MIKKLDDINDDQIRVLGKHQSTAPTHHGSLLWVVLAAVLAVLVVLVLCLNKSRSQASDNDLEQAYYEPEEQSSQETEPISMLGNYTSDDGHAYTEHIKKVINDIPLDIYIPHNAVPELCVGVPDMHDKSIVLTTQAADIRADNGKIVGAFVLKGTPLTWGLSKKGYCAIINGKITIGVAENSPLFEEATEQGGYFFRQYPLVDNGRLVENEPKNKSVRKAVCDRAGEVMVIMSQTPESFHDFAQALVDLNVDNAVYLVGSQYSYGYFRDKFDHFTQFCEKNRGGQKYENFIVWR